MGTPELLTVWNFAALHSSPGEGCLLRGVGREEDSRPVAAEDVPKVLLTWATWVRQDDQVGWMDKIAR